MNIHNLISNKIISFLLAFTLMGIIGCTQSQAAPPKELSGLKIGVVYSNGVLFVPSEKLIFKDFIEKGFNKPGKWEKADNSQWVYRIKNIDAVTKKQNEVSVLFIKHPERQDVVVLAKVAINGEYFNSYEKDDFFNRIAYNVLQLQEKQSGAAPDQHKQSIIQPSEKNSDDSCANAETTAEINECAEKKFADADKELNIVYKEIM